jgi:hypothetical protein
VEHNGTALPLLSDHTDHEQSLQNLCPQRTSQMHTTLDPIEAPIGKVSSYSRRPGDIDPPCPKGLDPLRSKTIVPVWSRLIVVNLDPRTAQHLVEQLYPDDPGQVIVTCTRLAQCRGAAYLARYRRPARWWRRSQGLERFEQGLHPCDIGTIDALLPRSMQRDKPCLA